MSFIKKMNQYVLISLLLFFSCNRIKNKSDEISTKVKSKIKVQSSKIIEKVYPHFDAYKTDTKENKLRFKDFIKIEITDDIKNIYCFDDAIGIDADYQFSFNCSPETADKIIRIHHFKLDTLNTDYGFGLQNDFNWWDKNKIEKLPLYTYTNNDRFFKHFWYDKNEKKAYYFDYDI